MARTVIRIKSDKRNEVIDIADRIREAWVNYSNPELGIIAEDENGVHNAISPTIIKSVNGYEMNVILRSNITSEKISRRGIPRAPRIPQHKEREYRAYRSTGFIHSAGQT